MRILLLSAYDAQSHQYWREGLVSSFPEYVWTTLVLPARYFNWRIRGNPLSWSLFNAAELSQSYDLIIATSMVDLATLKGLHPLLANTPSLVYFHENQFEYPKSVIQHQSLEPQMVNLYSAMSANWMVFNSEYNLTSFFLGIKRLINKLPDFVSPALIEQLRVKSSVVPVPLEDQLFTRPLITTEESTTLVWNHRWEYDKGPERLYFLLKALNSVRFPFKLHLLGQSFRQSPGVFSQIKAEFSHQLLTNGYVESKDAYLNILANSDIVLSTALHDFQGLSVMESVALGCIPLLPNRLAYPNFIDESYLYGSYLDPDDPGKEAQAAAIKLVTLVQEQRIDKSTARKMVEQYRWQNLRNVYKRLFEKLTNKSRI